MIPVKNEADGLAEPPSKVLCNCRMQGACAIDEKLDSRAIEEIIGEEHRDQSSQHGGLSEPVPEESGIAVLDVGHDVLDVLMVIRRRAVGWPRMPIIFFFLLDHADIVQGDLHDPGRICITRLCGRSARRQHSSAPRW